MSAKAPGRRFSSAPTFALHQPVRTEWCVFPAAFVGESPPKGQESSCAASDATVRYGKCHSGARSPALQGDKRGFRLAVMPPFKLCGCSLRLHFHDDRLVPQGYSLRHQVVLLPKAGLESCATQISKLKSHDMKALRLRPCILIFLKAHHRAECARVDVGRGRFVLGNSNTNPNIAAYKASHVGAHQGAASESWKAKSAA